MPSLAAQKPHWAVHWRWEDSRGKLLVILRAKLVLEMLSVFTNISPASRSVARLREEVRQDTSTKPGRVILTAKTIAGDESWIMELCLPQFFSLFKFRFTS